VYFDCLNGQLTRKGEHIRKFGFVCGNYRKSIGWKRLYMRLSGLHHWLTMWRRTDCLVNMHGFWWIRICPRIFCEVLVEREGFAFLVAIEYEGLPEFCTHYKNVGYNVTSAQIYRIKIYRTVKSTFTMKIHVLGSRLIKPTQWVILLHLSNEFIIFECQRYWQSRYKNCIELLLFIYWFA